MITQEMEDAFQEHAFEHATLDLSCRFCREQVQRWVKLQGPGRLHRWLRLCQARRDLGLTRKQWKELLG